MKRFLVWISLLLLLMVAVAAVGAEGEYDYVLRADGMAIIVRYNGSDAEPEIPAVLEEHPVVAIGDAAFYGCSALTRAVIPEGITSIGSSAFSQCENLTEAIFPSSVTVPRLSPAVIV